MKSHQFKNIFKKAIYKPFAWEPILGQLRKTALRNKIVVLLYHEIADDADEIDAWTVVKKKDFIRQMEYLSGHFSVVSLKEAFYRMNNCLTNGVEKPMAVVTFDDGYAGNRKVLLPAIQSMNIPVTIFVATKAVQDRALYWYDRLINTLQLEPFKINLKYMSLSNYQADNGGGLEKWNEIERLLRDLKTLRPEIRKDVVNDVLKDLKPLKAHSYKVEPLSIAELRELADCPLVTIGAHSHCHNVLTQISMDDLRKSVSTSKQLLESWTGKEVKYFAYPNGDYNDCIINVLKETGFECSLTTLAKPWKKGESAFEIPRISIGRYDAFEYFKIKVSGAVNGLLSI